MNFEYTLNGVSKEPEEFTTDEIESILKQFCEPLGIEVSRNKKSLRKKLSDQDLKAVSLK